MTGVQTCALPIYGEQDEKILVDLAIPADIHEEVHSNYSTVLIDITELRTIADQNLAERQSEFIAADEIINFNIQDFHHLYRTRSLELKMKEVPGKIREIKDKAINDVFAEEIEMLDEKSRELMNKMLDYMEKKCISVPMIMAKEIILNTSN